MRSLTSRLLVLWALSLVACAAVGLLLLQLYQQSTEAQAQRAEAVVTGACGLIRDRYQFYVSGWKGGAIDRDTRAGLAAVVAAALHDQQGIEGGLWQAGDGPETPNLNTSTPSPDTPSPNTSTPGAPSPGASSPAASGSIAYAYPTYQGSDPKTDVPAAELGRIAAVNRSARQEEQAALQRRPAGAETILLAACPLPGPLPDLTAWTMTRVRAVAGLGPLRSGLGVLLALVVGMSLWLARLVVTWTRSLRAIETTLRDHRAGRRPELGPTGLPELGTTGERELDRIVLALNETGRHLAEARERSERLARQVAASERLAALGRIAAGVAHEIRNPLAAMRIRAESARHGDDERRRRAIEVILGQVARLDHLVADLLDMTQRRQPHPRDVGLQEVADDIVAQLRDQAAAAAVTLRTEVAGRALLDPEMLGRALGNLLLNAVQHTPLGGEVVLSGSVEGARLRLVVGDTGSGVAPELRETLFEPFVTGRAAGTGLGLPIARECVGAMGGELTLLPAAEPTRLPTAAPALLLATEPALLPTAAPAPHPAAEPGFLPTAAPALLLATEPTVLPAASPTPLPAGPGAGAGARFLVDLPAGA